MASSAHAEEAIFLTAGDVIFHHQVEPRSMVLLYLMVLFLLDGVIFHVVLLYLMVSFNDLVCYFII